MSIHKTSNIPFMLKKRTLVIFLTGLLAGTLDGIAAVVHFFIKTGKDPALIFKYIASAMFGKSAYTTSGYSMVAAGLLFHFSIAIIFSAIFFLLFPKIAWIKKNKIASGIIYATIIWAIMNLIIVPFSRAPQPNFDIKETIINLIILIIFVGVPISLVANKYYLYKK